MRRNCLLKHAVEGNILDVKTKKKTYILDDPKETRGYFKLKEEALDRILRRTCSEEAKDLSEERLQNE